jgi:hypothetical protein
MDSASNHEESASLFKQFKRELARINEPVSTMGSMQLVPVNIKTTQLIGPNTTKRSLTDPTQIQPIRVRSRDGSKGGNERQEVILKPTSIECRLPFFGNEQFQLDDLGFEAAELVCKEDGNGRLSVAMDKSNGKFLTVLGLQDGGHLFAFRINGCLFPDPTRGRTLTICNSGIFSRLKVSRQTRPFTVLNDSPNAQLLRINSESDWLIPDKSQLDLQARSSAKILVHFNVARMKEGLNEGSVNLSVKEGERIRPAGAVQFAVLLTIDGAVSDVSVSPSEFGEVKQGIGKLHLNVKVTTSGRGPINGVITLPQSGELIDFHLIADGEPSIFTHTFQIESTHLPKPQPRQTQAELALTILTDSFLANRRLFRAKLLYKLLYLRKSLPALSFGIIRENSTKSLRLDVSRSDNEDIDLMVELPVAAANHVEIYQARPNAFVFRLNSTGLPAGTSYKEIVSLRDRKSGLRDQIKILATVASARKASLEDSTPRRDFSSELLETT